MFFVTRRNRNPWVAKLDHDTINLWRKIRFLRNGLAPEKISLLG
jgi:hypothetical protein